MRSLRNEVALLERREPDVAERPPEAELRWPPLSRTHRLLFVSTAAFYLTIVVAVLTSSRLVAWDWSVMLGKPYERWPQFLSFLNVYVVAGQRGPSAIVAYVWLAWRAWRLRSFRPLLAMSVALVLLNMSVGAVKLGLGRLGPHYAHVLGSAELFQGGDIFPSGHTSNAVVTWGVLAYLACRWRRTGSVVAGFMGISVGLTTVYLGTHWLSDVLAGWAAGVLVLLMLPLFEPVIASADERLLRLCARRAGRRARHARPAPAPLALPRSAPRPVGAPAPGAPPAWKARPPHARPAPAQPIPLRTSGAVPRGAAEHDRAPRPGRVRQAERM